MGCFIIAEAGVNHNGKIELAKKLVDEAKKCGADAVKFQTFSAEKLVVKTAKKAEYQANNTNNNDTQFEMLKNLELSRAEFIELKEYCDKKQIMFLTTAFDFDSFDFIINDLRVELIKIPSGEMTNLPLLEKCARTGLPVLLSTGMAEIHEIRESINVLNANNSGAITVLHCSTEYPAPINEVNLNAMVSLGREFNLPYGYSDHTLGNLVSFAAAAMGAKVIEKHFTLDKQMAGPDHAASIEPKELAELVNGGRIIEASLGDGVKRASVSEKKNINIARKCIVAIKNIGRGEKFTDENIGLKRAGQGISPMRWYEVIGKKAKRNFSEDEIIEI